MPRIAFICINGILTAPAKPDAWTDEAVLHILRKWPDDVTALKYEYFASPLFRRIGQKTRAQHIANIANSFRRSGYRVSLIGHSNGCALIAEVIANIGTEVSSVHLFAPAANEQDFEPAIEQDTVERIHIYGSKNDAALKLARVSRAAVGWLGLGYGSLGLRGPAFAAKHPSIVTDHSNDAYGHSDWFDPRANFLASMDLIAKHEGITPKPARLQPIAT